MIMTKRVKIKHLLNIDHTSHFVTFFLFVFFCIAYLFSLLLITLCVSGVSLFVQVRVDKSFILYFHTVLCFRVS